MKALKVLAIALLATCSVTAVNAQMRHRRFIRHHRHVVVRHHRIIERHHRP